MPTKDHAYLLAEHHFQQQPSQNHPARQDTHSITETLVDQEWMCPEWKQQQFPKLHYIGSHSRRPETDTNGETLLLPYARFD